MPVRARGPYTGCRIQGTVVGEQADAEVPSGGDVGGVIPGEILPQRP
ncbi:MAG: hypothetical protein ACRDUV_07345 [Pseudonocardiaceae bacterium]